MAAQELLEAAAEHAGAFAVNQAQRRIAGQRRLIYPLVDDRIALIALELLVAIITLLR